MTEEIKRAIHLENVGLQFEDVVVLHDLSYTFSAGKVTAILGKSGSGKTTLLQLLNGMIKPDRGEVTIFGELLNYEKLTELRLRMGYVIQQAGLFPHLNIRSNISILGKIKKLSADFINARLTYLMSLVQLPESFGTKYPYELSGGEQQRVGLCRAMFLNPPILLMDEPFASLDYETKQDLYDHFAHIQESEPRTIILVTHDWNEAIRLADEFIWLDEGKIKTSGGKEDLINARNIYFKGQ